MVSFRVRASSLSEVGTLLGTVVATFDANLAVVDSRVKASVGSAWEGEDADSFAEGWATFLATAGHVRQSLVALQGGLFAADGSYTQAESGIQRSFSGRVNSVTAIRATTGGVSARVDTGAERAEDIAEYFGRGDGDDGQPVYLAGVASRVSAANQGTGPAEDNEADADGDGKVEAEELLAMDGAASGLDQAVGNVGSASDAAGNVAASVAEASGSGATHG